MFGRRELEITRSTNSLKDTLPSERMTPRRTSLKSSICSFFKDRKLRSAAEIVFFLELRNMKMTESFFSTARAESRRMTSLGRGVRGGLVIWGRKRGRIVLRS